MLRQAAFPLRFIRPAFPILTALPFTVMALAGLGFAALSAAPAEATTISDRPTFPTLTYWDNWTDAQGVSHLTRCLLTNFRPFTGSLTPPATAARPISAKPRPKTETGKAPVEAVSTQPSSTPGTDGTGQSAQHQPAQHQSAQKSAHQAGAGKGSGQQVAADSKPSSGTPAKPPLTAMIWTGMSHSADTNITTIVQPPGWQNKWTAAKHVRWIVPLAGTYTVDAMDGTRVELNPGDLLLSEDIGSKPDAQGRFGHRSRNEGKNAVAYLVTQLANKSTPPLHPCMQK
ncbi:cupin domain-containing protein [Oecophyllibacter saccharovorans]|uniref:Uncharacterized protein n=1 Tax=Oecophyllibacter saccharovorans TaxID=2558360 RepID=A0A506UL70_9PROT|nr:hypothetical protein [Oecophyllibacter saccharovorans]TPW34091.1 hypothetical protein E3202_06015 [Oecophyllibacter saccharovorans]